jgi:hypothetical protein
MFGATISDGWRITRAEFQNGTGEPHFSRLTSRKKWGTHDST